MIGNFSQRYILKDWGDRGMMDLPFVDMMCFLFLEWLYSAPAWFYGLIAI